MSKVIPPLDINSSAPIPEELGGTQEKRPAKNPLKIVTLLVLFSAIPLFLLVLTYLQNSRKPVEPKNQNTVLDRTAWKWEISPSPAAASPQPQNSITPATPASVKPSAVSLEPVIPQSESIEQIILNANSKKRSDAQIVKASKSDKPTMDTQNMKIRILGAQSGSTIIREARAAGSTAIYPLIFTNPSEAEVKTLSKKLGFNSDPTYPDPNFKHEYLWSENNRKLHIWPTGGIFKIDFEKQATGSGTMLAGQAENTAKIFARDLGFNISNFETTYPSFPGYQITGNLQVLFLRKFNGHRVYPNDMDIVYPGIGAISSEMDAVVGSNLDVTKFHHATYGQSIDETPIIMNEKDLRDAIDELKLTGGAVRSLEEKNPQVGFSCLNNICRIKNPVVTLAYPVYYQNNLLPGFTYKNLDNTDPQPYDYLVPIWLFPGTGTVTKTDGTRTIEAPVEFTTAIPAFHKGNDKSIVRIKDFSLERETTGSAGISAKFKVAYNFPKTAFSDPQPRQGINYKAVVLYPDNTYTEFFNLMYTPIYGETLEIPIPLGTKGTVTVYLELTDFDGTIEKKEFQI